MRKNAPNNGMHPTPHHGASHVRRAGARVMPGVRALRFILIHDRDSRVPTARGSFSSRHLVLLVGPRFTFSSAGRSGRRVAPSIIGGGRCEMSQ
jgi:hypothetical protein